MLEIKTTTKKWGNSVGVIIPKSMGIKEGEKVRIHIEPEERYTKVKDIFGTFHFKKSTAEIMKEVDEELDSEL